MKCGQCDQEATVHEVTIRNGKKIERHLCERCARKQGIAVQPQIPINELITKFVLQGPAQAPGAGSKATVCPACGTAYAEFRQSGLLGCPECYAAFAAQLGPLLERAHEGGTHHVGRSPRRAAPRILEPPPEPMTPARDARRAAAERAGLLRKALAEAVRNEQYERAASLRDEIRRLSQAGGEAPAPGAGPDS